MAKKIIFLILLFSVNLIAMATSRALLVGIGDYDTDKTGWEKLHGDKDVDLLTASLVKRGFERDNIKTLKNNRATKRQIISSLKTLASETRPGDFVMFHFSGHGQPVFDLNGDEANGSDEAIVPYDAYKTPRYKIENSFYQGENHIIDDELFFIFNEIKKKVGNSGYFLVTIDACYSRGIEMDETEDLTPEEQKRVGGVRGTDHIFKVNEKSPLKKIAKPTSYNKIGRMTVISACREDERNFEYKNPDTKEIYGSLSFSLASLLNKGYSFQKIEKYFSNREYTSDQIFTISQHPKVKSL